MKTTITLLLLTILGYGFWGFFSKLATAKVGNQILIWNGIAFLIGGIGYLAVSKELLPLKLSSEGMMYSFLAGITVTIASVAFYTLLKREPAGFVVTAAALYPIVTLLLSALFLNEQITIGKGVGFILAFVALWLLSA